MQAELSAPTRSSLAIAPLRQVDRPGVLALLDAVPSFDAAERAVAAELMDVALDRPEQTDYRFLVADLDGRLGGYLCYGPTPMTQGTFDLYWLATHPELARRGIARALVARMEEELRADGARLVRVETSNQDAYGSALSFYLSTGFAEEGRFRDFYRPGEDLIVLSKNLGTKGILRPPGTLWESPDLYDVAFGYRDFARECEFLLACTQKWGRPEVQRVLEWACGPSQHLCAFANHESIDCVGVDHSGAMVDLARRRLAGRPRVQVIEGDLCSTVVSPPVDLAYTLLSSIHQLVAEADLVAHLRTTVRSLQPGGLYVIEATHPRDLTPDGTSATDWTEQRGDVRVRSRFQLDRAGIRGEIVPISLSIESREAQTLREYRLETLWRVPDVSGWERILAQVPELEWVARLGDLDIAVRSDHPAAWRLVLVLRRRA